MLLNSLVRSVVSFITISPYLFSPMAEINGTHNLNIESELRERLSAKASVDWAIANNASSIRPRWTTFDAPKPKHVVSVATEEDVAQTVDYCAQHNLKFLAQNGGASWATTSKLGDNGVWINLAQLDQSTLSADKTEAIIGGGALAKQTIKLSSDAGVAVLTGNFECVGTLGALLGGGYGYLNGLYGTGVDTVISMRVVLPDGHLHTVTQQSDPDLVWALRGAGPNFSIVTSATVRAYPIDRKLATAWTGPVVSSSDQLEEVVQTINDLVLDPEMNIFMYFASSGPPDNASVIITQTFQLGGNKETGREKFASLFNIGPLMDNTTTIPYSMFAAGSAPFCIPGRKPANGAGFDQMVPSTWRQVWELYVNFQKRPGAENGFVLLESYLTDKIRSISGSSASFPHRHVEYNAIASGWYTDPNLDSAAVEFGSKVRDVWRNSDGCTKNATYINFAHGDEDLEVVYGNSLPRLREWKKRIDPNNIFDQWFNIR